MNTNIACEFLFVRQYGKVRLERSVASFLNVLTKNSVLSSHQKKKNTTLDSAPPPPPPETLP